MGLAAMQLAACGNMGEYIDAPRYTTIRGGGPSEQKRIALRKKRKKRH